MYKNYLKLCYSFSLMLLILFAAPQVYADGSKDLYPSGAKGNRAFLLSKSNPFGDGNDNSWPYLTLGVHFVYAKVGETIAAASSAQNVGSGRIRLISPNGTSYTSSANNTGKIESRSQELNGPGIAGGYTPFEHTVGSNEIGVWRVEFIPPGGETSSGIPETNILANSNWTQGSNRATIAAWDVSVRNGSTWIPGRVYVNVFNFHLSSNFLDTQGWYAKTYVLTRDGIAYRVTSNGSNGIGFTFFVNNKGFTKSKSDVNPSYKSLNSSKPNDLAGRVHDPRNSDDVTNVTHKIFYTKPAADLPTEATIAGGGTTWLKIAERVPIVSNFAFTGSEGTPNQAGIKGGNIKFDVDIPGSYRILIDGNGAFPARMLTGLCTAGENVVVWDGKAGAADDPLTAGGSVPAGTTIGEMSVQVFGAEVHFPYIDMEINPGGIIIERTNSNNYELYSPTQDIVYWDDRDITGGNNTTKTNPMYAGFNGASSNNNGHKWGSYSSSASGSDNNGTGNWNFGNEKSMDTWSYVPGNVVTTSVPIKVSEADLEIVSLTPDKTQLSVGGQLTYTVLVRNNHNTTSISEVSGAQFGFHFPAGLSNITVAAPTFSGSGSEASRDAITATDFAAYLNLASGETATYVITGTISSALAGQSIPVEATIMRPPDVTDPDATSESNPTDPEIECNGTLGSNPGNGCNNIQSNGAVSVLLNALPTVMDIVMPTGKADTPIAFSADVFKEEFSDTDNDALSSVRLTGLPAAENGTLVLNGNPIVENQEIPVDELGNLSFVPTSGWTGEVNFFWNGADGKVYASTPANVKITIEPRTTDLAVTKVADKKQLEVNEAVSYKIKITNQGTETILANKEIGLTENLPIGLTNISYTATGGTFNADDETFTLNADLATNAAVGLEVSAKVKADYAGTELINEVTASAAIGTEDLNGTNNTAAVTIPIVKGGIALRMTGVLSADGNTITYTYTVTNTSSGNLSLSAIEIVNNYTGGTAPILQSGDNGDQLLAVDEAWIYTSTYTITQVEKDAGVVNHSATVKAKTPVANVVIDDSGTSDDNDGDTNISIPKDPSLMLEKTGVLSTDGNTITYTFKVKNTGNVTMKDITVSDSKTGMPAIVLAKTTLAPDEETTGAVSYTITQTEKDEGQVSNQAKVMANDPDGDALSPVSSDDPGTPTPNDATIVNVPKHPSLSLEKTGVLSADGNTITYTFKVKNTGNVTIKDIAVSDKKTGMPAIVLAKTTLAPDEEATGTATYTITQTEKDAGEVSNQATVTANDPGGDALPPVSSDNPGTTDPNDTTVVNVPKHPSLSLEKTGVLSADGNTITYTFKVKNTGNVTMKEITVSDGKVGMPTVALTKTTLTPNEETTGTATYTITQVEKDAGEVNNQATVTGDNPDGDPLPPVSSDDPATTDPNDATLVEIPKHPSLSLEKTGVLLADGNTITYTFKVKNTGNITMKDITVSDGKVGIPVIVLTKTTLAPDEETTGTATYIITQAEKDSGEVSNQATVTGNDPDGDALPPINSDDPGSTDPNDATIVAINQISALNITKREISTGPYGLGDQIKYAIVLENKGNVTLSKVTIQDVNGTILDGNPAVSLLPGIANAVTVHAYHTVTQADIDAGSVSNQATVTGEAPSGAPTLPVNIVSDDPDTDTPNDATETDILQKPALKLTKSSVAGTFNKIGDVIHYKLQVSNSGNVTIKHIVITDDYADKGSILPAVVEILAVGETKVISAKHTLTQEDLDRGYVYNVAIATGEDPMGHAIMVKSVDEQPLDPKAPADPDCPTCTITPIEQHGALRLTKSSAAGRFKKIGDIINYRLKLTNTGNVTISDIMLSDPNADAGSIRPANMETLAVGETKVITAKHTITQEDLDRGFVYNEATASGKDPKGNDITIRSVDEHPLDLDAPKDPDCLHCTITPLDPEASMSMVKTVTNKGSGENGVFILNDKIAYTFIIKNTGAVTLSNIVLNDPLLGRATIQLPGELAPGASLSHTEYYTVTQKDIDNTQVINQAEVKAETPTGEEVGDKSGTGGDNDEPTVIAVGKKPNAVNDKVTVVENIATVLLILDNDEAGSSALVPASIKVVEEPSHGSIDIGADGKVTYTPDRDYIGSDVFTYTISDKNGLVSNGAQVSITIRATRPKAVDDHDETGFNQRVTIPVLDNDETDGAALNPSTIVVVGQPQNGTAVVGLDGSVNYTPNPGYTGRESFTYQVRDENGNTTNEATVYVDVTGFFVPNTITPNGDGKNDQFQIVGIEAFDQVELFIFNRWGAEVYRNQDYHNTWDGANLNEGTYYFLLHLKKGDNNKVMKGWVLIKRQ